VQANNDNKAASAHRGKAGKLREVNEKIHPKLLTASLLSDTRLTTQFDLAEVLSCEMQLKMGSKRQFARVHGA